MGRGAFLRGFEMSEIYCSSREATRPITMATHSTMQITRIKTVLESVFFLDDMAFSFLNPA